MKLHQPRRAGTFSLEPNQKDMKLRIHQVRSMPSNPEAGNIYFDLSDKKLKIPQSNGSIVVFGSQVIDSALSGTSTNPVQNKAVKAELDKKAATTHSHNAATTILPGFMSDADKRKLDSIESGAEANVQSDWNASSTSDAYIKNKPSSMKPSGTAGGSLSGTYPNPTIKSSVSLPGNPITTTQPASDDSTKIATTAFVHSLVDARVWFTHYDISQSSTNPMGGAFNTSASSVLYSMGVRSGDLLFYNIDGKLEDICVGRVLSASSSKVVVSYGRTDSKGILLGWPMYETKNISGSYSLDPGIFARANSSVTITIYNKAVPDPVPISQIYAAGVNITLKKASGVTVLLSGNVPSNGTSFMGLLTFTWVNESIVFVDFVPYTKSL